MAFRALRAKYGLATSLLQTAKRIDVIVAIQVCRIRETGANTGFAADRSQAEQFQTDGVGDLPPGSSSYACSNAEVYNCRSNCRIEDNPICVAALGIGSNRLLAGAKAKFGANAAQQKGGIRG